MKIERIQGIRADVSGLAAAIDANPQLWDEHRMRTQSKFSPHRESSDIWVRYNAIENFTTLAEFNAPHESSWYPSADVLHVKPFVLDVMRLMGGTRLGGVLITKVPAGKQIYPHSDQGWHARHYEKFAIQIRGNERQAFCFEGERLVTAPGDIYTFDNSHRHWVTNDSDEDRLTMIVCIGRD